MDTDVQQLGEVGMDDVIQSDTEIVTDAPAGEPTGEGPAAEGTGTTSQPDVAQEVTFYNASDVPEELRPTFQEMKKAYTQKTQALAAKVKEAESAQHHANLFRRLMSDDRVVQFLSQIDQNGTGIGPQGGAQPSGGYSSEDADMDPAVAALQQQVQKLQGELTRTRQRQDLDAEKQAFIAAHPDWQNYQDGMEEAWKRVPHRSYEDAYNWAFRQSYLTRKANLERKRTRSQASVERPGPSADTTRAVKVDSFGDAVRAALDELGMSRSEFKV